MALAAQWTWPFPLELSVYHQLTKKEVCVFFAFVFFPSYFTSIIHPQKQFRGPLPPKSFNSFAKRLSCQDYVSEDDEITVWAT